MQLFKIDTENRKLLKINSASLSSQGFNEPQHLETWIINNEKDIFEKNILWITRQDSLNSEQRSDLIGIDNEGDLVICELKQGIVNEGALLQALGYASEYYNKDLNDISQLFFTHYQKGHIQNIKLNSADEAKQKINDHITLGKQSEEIKVNEFQIIVLVGENFTANALSIVDFLNNSSESLTYLIECWRYQVFPVDSKSYQIGFEQILPPPNIRDDIANKREEIKSSKYARDRNRINFMYSFISEIKKRENFIAWRAAGASYYCYIQKKAFEDLSFIFNVYGEFAYLTLPNLPYIDKIELSNKHKLSFNEDKYFITFLEYKNSELKINSNILDEVVTLIDKILSFEEKKLPLS
ncbi:hypothetical protein KA977_06705 [Candidatus Dependentiae bacterium]|nr:hypothetical protein [Candidatus Dependentiae bacterium]